MIKALDTKLHYARRITWASFTLLVLTLGINAVLGNAGTLIIFMLLPLVIFIPGMARENYKSLAMLSFVSLMYFVPVVVQVWEPARSIGDIISLMLICTLFTSSMLFSRWKQYHLAGNP